MKEIEIMDYRGKKTTIKIRNFNDVVKLQVEVISGDEVLHILYKDYSQETYDSCYMLNNSRMINYFDFFYTIYDITENVDRIEKWAKRKSSYDV